MRCWVLLDSEYNIYLYRQVRARVRVGVIGWWGSGGGQCSDS
jgi:hypothetical protein